jgi:hypothetical protein
MYEILRLEKAGLTMQIQPGMNLREENEYCDQRATGATAGITKSKGARP